MKRIDTPDKAVDLFGSGKHGFSDGVAPGSSSTSLDASHFNHAQEEVANVIEGVDIALDSTSYVQLVAALDKRQALQASRNWQSSATTAIGSNQGHLRAVAGGTVSNKHYWVAVGDENVTATEAAIYWANHGAGTWTAETGVPQNDLNDITFDSNTGTFIAVGDAGSAGADATIYTANVPGATWTEIVNPKDFDLSKVHAASSGTIIAVGAHDGTDAYCIRSTNAGATWAEIAVVSVASSTAGLGIANNGSVWVIVGKDVSTNPLVWVSTDDGLTFSVVTGLPAVTTSLIGVNWDGTAFVAVSAGVGTAQVMTSPTGASSSWTLQTSITQTTAGGTMLSMATDPINGIVVCNDTQQAVYVSTDSGVTFSSMTMADETGASPKIGFDDSWCIVSADTTNDVMHGVQSLMVVE